MKRLLIALALLAGGLWAYGQEPAGPPGTKAENQIQAALAAQLEALNSEDVDAVMATFHPKAPGRDSARKGLVDMFRRFDLRYRLAAFRFVAVDGRYAYARAVQETQGRGTPDRTEQLFVFRKSGARWAFWTSVVLDKPAPRKE